ncbi:MAG: peptide deformylase [Candidatus Nealsonbacteria bacterium]
MSNMEVVKYPSPILRKKAEEVSEITPEIKKLVEEMVQVLEKEKGSGLAAPQIGISKRVIVFETGEGTAALINPKIIKKGKDKFIDTEGCLSFPGLWLKIKRPRTIEVEATDLKGEKVKLSAEYMVARILQHELDHLDGVLFTDRIDFFQKFKISKNLKILKKQYGSSR